MEIRFLQRIARRARLLCDPDLLHGAHCKPHVDGAIDPTIDDHVDRFGRPRAGGDLERVEARREQHLDGAEAGQLEVAGLEDGGAAVERRVPPEHPLGPPGVDHGDAHPLGQGVQPVEVPEHTRADEESHRGHE